MDKEFAVLDIIDKNESITQREISKKTNLSLGSVNLLLNKMVRDGLIKIKQVPMNRVAYMLTPKGMSEKVNKTYNYIKVHYSYINETKGKLKESLSQIKIKYNKVAVLIEQDEISELVRAAALEVKGVDIYEDVTNIKPDNMVVVTNSNTIITLTEQGFQAINLLEMI